MDFDKKTEKDIGMFRTFLYGIYPQFTRKTVRRHKICVLLRCFDSMYARYMSFLRALPGTNFMPFDSGDLKRREFLHFQGRRRRRTGSTLIEDNAENEEIIILRRVVPCKLRVKVFHISLRNLSIKPVSKNSSCAESAYF